MKRFYAARRFAAKQLARARVYKNLNGEGQTPLEFLVREVGDLEFR
jgi:hypothetical protein